MSGPGSAKPGLRSIRAAEQEERAEAFRSGFSADRYPRGIDRAIRLSTEAAVFAGGGDRGVCLLQARLRGRPGTRRDQDHRPVRAGHARRPRLCQFDAVRGAAPGPGTLPGPLTARPGDRGDPCGEHGPGLVPRPGRGGSRGLAGDQSRLPERRTGRHPRARCRRARGGPAARRIPATQPPPRRGLAAPRCPRLRRRRAVTPGGPSRSLARSRADAPASAGSTSCRTTPNANSRSNSAPRARNQPKP
jgi:hypothetical protein